MIDEYLKFYLGVKCCYYVQERYVSYLNQLHISCWKSKKYQLALRPISSVTDKEIKSLRRLDKSSLDKQAELIKELIKLNIDVFDLISKELAVNINKL